MNPNPSPFELEEVPISSELLKRRSKEPNHEHENVTLMTQPQLAGRPENRAELISRTNGDLLPGKDFGKQTRQSEKMRAIDARAAGIAHDFNNVLQIVQSYTELIMRNPTEANDVVAHAEVIRASVEEGTALVRQLLAVAGKTETKLDLADLNNFILCTTKSLNAIFPVTIVVATELDACVPMIMFDAHLIYQAMLNLCINARDAMPSGGKILVQTGISSGLSVRQYFPRASEEQYVYIRVADSGVGMQAQVRSRVFEPYFTTKKPGQGTGLGLSRVHGIVTEHAGFIALTSELGHGSTVQIYLPVPGDHVAGDDVVSS